MDDLFHLQQSFLTPTNVQYINRVLKQDIILDPSKYIFDTIKQYIDPIPLELLNAFVMFHNSYFHDKSIDLTDIDIICCSIEKCVTFDTNVNDSNACIELLRRHTVCNIVDSFNPGRNTVIINGVFELSDLILMIIQSKTFLLVSNEYHSSLKFLPESIMMISMECSCTQLVLNLFESRHLQLKNDFDLESINDIATLKMALHSSVNNYQFNLVFHVIKGTIIPTAYFYHDTVDISVFYSLPCYVMMAIIITDNMAVIKTKNPFRSIGISLKQMPVKIKKYGAYISPFHGFELTDLIEVKNDDLVELITKRNIESSINEPSYCLFDVDGLNQDSYETVQVINLIKESFNRFSLIVFQKKMINASYELTNCYSVIHNEKSITDERRLVHELMNNNSIIEFESVHRFCDMIDHIDKTFLV